MKYSLSIYSFYSYIKSNKMTVLECLPLIKEMGFDAVEFVDFIFPKDKDKKEFAITLKKKCDELGLLISNYAVGGELLNTDNISLEIEKIKEEIDICELLGSPLLRHDITSGPSKENFVSYDVAVKSIAKACIEITTYAKQKGIKTMTENHGFYSQDSIRVEKLVNEVKDNNFGLLVDIGNFLCADDNPAIATGRCAPYAFYYHVKDFCIKDGNGFNPGKGFFMSRGGNYLKGTIIGHGNVPVIQCLKIIKNSSYDSFIAIEFEGLEDPFVAVPICLENLKSFISLI